MSIQGNVINKQRKGGEMKMKMMGEEGKKTRGRQRIEMKMIDDKDNRLISFSKRRSGIYKKASELGTLCGAHSAVIIFSQSHKPFSFGFPSVNSLIRRFFNLPTHPDSLSAAPFLEAHRLSRIQLLNYHHNRLSDHLHLHKNRSLSLSQHLKNVKSEGGGGGCWWEKEVEDMCMEEVSRLAAAVEDIQGRVLCRLNQLKDASLPPSLHHSVLTHNVGDGDGGLHIPNLPYLSPTPTTTPHFLGLPSI